MAPVGLEITVNILDQPRTTVPNGSRRHGNSQTTLAVLDGSLTDLVSMGGRRAKA